MDIKHNGSQPSGKGPEAYFTGNVRVDPLHTAPDPARVSVAQVTFEPGARTAWHRDPLGQTLIVTSGSGRVQSWGGLVEEIRPGDLVWTPPKEKHWHGAAPTTAMSHISIVEQLHSHAVDWMEHVSRNFDCSLPFDPGLVCVDPTIFEIGTVFGSDGTRDIHL